MSEPLQLSALTLYPIKSAGGVALTEGRITPYGLEHDREWMVVDARARQITGRNHPRITLVEVRLEAAGLVVSAPGMPELSVPWQAQGQARAVTVFGHPLEARSVGDAAAAWWSAYLGVSCELVQFLPTSHRRMNPQYGDALIRFVDGNPLHLVSEASLMDLNSRLVLPVTLERFRGNLTVLGSEPYAEDRWRRIRIGELTLEVVEPCARCSMVNITHGTMMPEPLRTLAGYRRSGRQIPFGQNLTLQGEGWLRLGDRIEVLEQVSQGHLV